MTVSCPHCQLQLEFAGVRPKFCGHCGQPLAPAVMPVTLDDPAEAATPAPRQRGDTETILPVPSAAQPDASVPQSMGPYRLVRRLGGGGMGTVYEAEDTLSGRRVALKLIQADHAASPSAIERFRQEGQLASKLSHPRCVFVLAADEVHGRPYIVMELMSGSTLADVVKEQGPLPPEIALRQILDVIEGLQEAHHHGLIHRDVKPSNCFVDEHGRVKVGDFGLAKSLVEPAQLTRTGTFVGTPLFAAPEQIKMEAVDARSDVYSVAATLFFLLTGRAPFQTTDATATLARIMADPVPPMRTLRPELPRSLDKVVLRGLERDRKRRWRTLEEFRQALNPFLPAEPSVGGVGLRFVAYWIDAIVLLLPNVGIQFAFNAIFKGRWAEPTGELLVPLALDVSYFAMMEGIYGWSLGKRVLRLRVASLGGTRPPGLRAAFVRALIFFALASLADWVLRLLNLVCLPEGAAGREGSPRALQLMELAIALAGFGAGLVGLGLMAYTMRKRNGYRGLHEVLSGTRTYRLHWPRRRKRPIVKPAEFHIAARPAVGIPDSLGPYRIRGSLRSTTEEQTLLADDAALHRSVWLWVRLAAEPTLTTARHDVSRPTRARWLSCGKWDKWQWDAFLAPSGRPLTALVADGRPLAWAEFRDILEDLTDELAAACEEGTVPATLSPNQVWLDSAGRALLLDMPVADIVAVTTSEQLSAATEQRRARTFLRDISILALEGRDRPTELASAPIEAPLPLPAARLINQLMEFPADAPDHVSSAPASREGVACKRPTPAGIGEFRAELRETAAQPAEVTRSMRAWQLLTQGLSAALGLWLVVVVANTVVSATLSWRSVDPGQASVREKVAIVSGYSLGVGLFFLPGLITRGGLSFLRSGIAVVHADGRRATRFRCLWRAVVSWIFVAWLGILIYLGRGPNPLASWRGLSAVMVAAALLIGYIVVMLRNPVRAPHDYVAGTYLVPM